MLTKEEQRIEAAHIAIGRVNEALAQDNLLIALMRATQLVRRLTEAIEFRKQRV